MVTNGPIGRSTAEAAATRVVRSQAYRNARDEYARIRQLRRTNPVAAHLRERRLELGLTQQCVAIASGTSHTAISRLESGTHTPQIDTLRRFAAVLGDELVICFERVEEGEVKREVVALVSE